MVSAARWSPLGLLIKVLLMQEFCSRNSSSDDQTNENTAEYFLSHWNTTPFTVRKPFRASTPLGRPNFFERSTTESYNSKYKKTAPDTPAQGHQVYRSHPTYDPNTPDQTQIFPITFTHSFRPCSTRLNLLYLALKVHTKQHPQRPPEETLPQLPRLRHQSAAIKA